MSREIIYLNEYHRKHSEALQESVRKVAKQPFSKEQFIEQANRVLKKREEKGKNKQQNK